MIGGDVVALLLRRKLSGSERGGHVGMDDPALLLLLLLLSLWNLWSCVDVESTVESTWEGRECEGGRCLGAFGGGRDGGDDGCGP